MHHEILSKEEMGVGTSTSPRDLLPPGYCQVQLPVTTGSPSPGLICSAPTEVRGPWGRNSHAQLCSQCKIHTQQKKHLSATLQSLIPAHPTHSPRAPKLLLPSPPAPACFPLYWAYRSCLVSLLSCVSPAQEVQISSTLRQQPLLLCFSPLTPNGLHILDHSFSIPLFWPFL